MKDINISQVDTLFVDGSFPIEFIFFYDYRIKTDTIRKTLRILSKPFWLLFSKYNDGSIHFKNYAENKIFSEEVYHNDFDRNLNAKKIWEEYHNINPTNMESLFFISILQYNNGTVIIPKLNHLAGDGYSYFYFLSILAALSNHTNSRIKKFTIKRISQPFLNRTSLRNFHFTNTNIEKPFEHNNCTIKIEKIPKTSVKEEMRNIKDKYNFSVSTNDILSAKVFKRTFEIKKSYNNKKFSLVIPIDVRRQVKELGSKYFGNGLLFHHLNLSVSELEEISRDELAMALRKSIPKIDTNNYINYLKTLEKQIKQSSIHSLKPYNPKTGCLVTNLSRLPIQKLNYGSGRPSLVLPLTIGKNAAGILDDKDNYILRLVY